MAGSDELLLDALLEDGAMEILDFSELDVGLAQSTSLEKGEGEPLMGGLLEGEPLLQVAKPEPEDEAAKVEDEDPEPETKESKKQRRLIRNRMSAQLHRERKKAYVDHLEGLVKARDDEIAVLKEAVASLRSENEQLRKGVMTHSVSSQHLVDSGYVTSSSDGVRQLSPDASPQRDPLLEGGVTSSDDDDSVKAATKAKRRRVTKAPATMATLALAAVSCVALLSSHRRGPAQVRAPAADLQVATWEDSYPSAEYSYHEMATTTTTTTSRRKLLELSDREFEDDARPAPPLLEEVPYNKDARTVELFMTRAHNATLEAAKQAQERASAVVKTTLRGARPPPPEDGEPRGGPWKNQTDSYVVCTQAAGVLNRPTALPQKTTQTQTSSALVPKTKQATRVTAAHEPALEEPSHFMHLVLPATDMDFSAWSDHYHPQAVDQPKWVELGCNLAYARLRFS